MIFRLVAFISAFRKDLTILLAAMSRRDTPRRVKILFPLLLLYVISPLDIVPDSIPLLGIVDDAVIFPAAVSYLLGLLPSGLRAENNLRMSRYAKLFFLIASIVIVLWIAFLIYLIYRIFF